MNGSDIRQRFLEFYGRHGHTIVESSSLIPHNDPTLFFVNAGMVQFKDVFTGAEERAYSRAATAQKCLRVSGKHNDLENVGRTPRHHTFFEMLGNFSFGDYFKEDAIAMAWELFTGELGIDADRIWVTVYEDDDEAYDLWRSRGFPAERLQRLGAKENFWSMGDTGPCGPCSELHYDYGAAIDPKGGGPATDSPRYVEFCNLVFMQYDQSADGARTALPRPSIDTGAGLERIAAIKQGVYSNYDTDLFRPLIARGAELAGARYGASDASDTALRVIADHARATAFLVGDGVMPSNEGRGYVLRRVMRRAIRFGVKLGIDRPFLHEITRTVGEGFAGLYPDLADRHAFIEEVVRSEEERFRRTLDRGMRLLQDALDQAGAGGTVPGDVAFTLDLTQLIAGEAEVQVDGAGFQDALNAQRARGRAAWKGSGEQAVAGLWRDLADKVGQTTFTGYTRDDDTGTVVALVRQEQGEDGELESTLVDRLEAGEKGVVVVDRTPFYVESGGQIGDTGAITHDGGAFRVTDALPSQGLRLHHGEVTRGALTVDSTVHLTVDAGRRDQTRRNHTATHLLHAALREVLGEHVTQKGSLVGPDRLRFDFAHHKAVTAEEVAALEDRVNEQILLNTAVQTDLQSLEEARAAGAMALFGEKYDADVRVVSVGPFSKELCGGTHVRRAGDIGLFRVTSESSVAAGVRRIEAQTGTGALRAMRADNDLLSGVAAALRTSTTDVVDAAERLQADRKALEKELEALKRELAKAAAGDLAAEARDIAGVKVLAARFDGDLREQADRLRDQLGTSLVVLVAASDDKVQLLAAVTKDIAGSKLHAGKVIQAVAPLVAGRGGGRPDLAQAGGKDPAGIPALIDAVYAFAADKLGA